MSWDKHPNVRTGDALAFKERAAEAVSRSIGSWSFLGWQTLIVGVWIIANTVAVLKHFDPYPFILLNLAFSTQAAYATPIILLAQKRQDTRQAEVAHSDHQMLIAICERLGVPTEDPAGGPGEDPQGVPSGEPARLVIEDMRIGIADSQEFTRMGFASGGDLASAYAWAEKMNGTPYRYGEDDCNE